MFENIFNALKTPPIPRELLATGPDGKFERATLDKLVDHLFKQAHADPTHSALANTVGATLVSFMENDEVGTVNHASDPKVLHALVRAGVLQEVSGKTDWYRPSPKVTRALLVAEGQRLIGATGEITVH